MEINEAAVLGNKAGSGLTFFARGESSAPSFQSGVVLINQQTGIEQSQDGDFKVKVSKRKERREKKEKEHKVDERRHRF